MSRNVLVVVGTEGRGVVIARRQGCGRQVRLADADATALEVRVDGLDGLDGKGCDVSGFPVDVGGGGFAEGAGRARIRARRCGPGRPHSRCVAGAREPGGDPSSRAPRVALSLDIVDGVADPGDAGVVIASMAGHVFGPLRADQAAAVAATAAPDLLGWGFLHADVASTPDLANGIAQQPNHIRGRAAARSWSARSAGINSISPRVIATAMGRQELADASAETMRSMIEGSVTERVGTAPDITAATAFLGRESSFVPRTDLLVDGGVVATVAAQG
ncbi:SDR family oxidoreductase [Gordonia oryzae]|uniref:SDR family oxidoreductase n=1 Tax=Gordonia oryzae TaxID=2487349 RepID=UPI001FE4741E|nr:SDR family oxidoreductase [Gordonia oryzae]